MKNIFNISPAFGTIIAAVVIAVPAFMILDVWKSVSVQQARDAAVDNCMQNARYNWQEKNRSDETLVNSTSEPNRFWYKLCMQEKGYEVRIEI